MKVKSCLIIDNHLHRHLHLHHLRIPSYRSSSCHCSLFCLINFIFSRDLLSSRAVTRLHLPLIRTQSPQVPANSIPLKCSHFTRTILRMSGRSCCIQGYLPMTCPKCMCGQRAFVIPLPSLKIYHFNPLLQSLLTISTASTNAKIAVERDPSSCVVRLVIRAVAQA